MIVFYNAKNANLLYFSSETLKPVPSFFSFVIYSFSIYLPSTFSVLALIEYKLNKTFVLLSRNLESNKEER